MKLPASLLETLGIRRVQETHALSGGNTYAAYRLETDQGRVFFKSGPAEKGLFASEANSLQALAQSGTSLRVPAVLAFADDYLCLEWLEPGVSNHADEHLGTGLAELHRAASDRFGFEHDTWCGPTRQSNRWHEHFVSFYAHERLEPVFALAEKRQALEPTARQDFERLLLRLPELLAGVRGSPRLIHGDLWSGNVVQTSEGPALADPACAFAHPEAEWGMMQLFGGFSERTLAAYQSSLPLEPEWEERNPLFQLYHLLNHAAIFGGHYGVQALRVVRKFL